MNIHESNAKSILRTHKKIDSWFISRYGMNLYRGCTHNCVYCDGRNEKYRVTGDFGRTVDVKINAIEILRKELSTKIRKKTLKKGYIMIGGGVGDSYQSVEEKYKLTRKTLQLLMPFKLPIHILTKATLLYRDIDLLHRIKDHASVILSFSFSSTNDEISSFFESGVPPPSKRLEMIKTLKKEGFTCGVYFLPVIPYITDTSTIIKQSIKDFSESNVDFIIFGGMTLKDGAQKDYFYHKLKAFDPTIIAQYEMIYKNNRYGNALASYNQSLHKTFSTIMSHYDIPVRIPPNLFVDILDENDRVIVLLEHLDYILTLQGKKTPYGYAAYQLSKVDVPLSSMETRLQTIKGVGPSTERIIHEILKTGSSSYYEQLLRKK